jgi:bacteriocin biosynthesis cyclodehydratase domain-containing protein
MNESSEMRPVARPVARPVISPGLPVVARPDGDLQIGLTERHRLRIPDSPAARRTLAALARGECPDDPAARRVLRRLSPVLRDGGELVQPGLPSAEMAALSLRHPGTALTRLAARRSTAVTVQGDLGIDVRRLLATTALGTGARPDRRVTLVLCAGEPDRIDLDAMLREREPHLLLRAVEGEVVLGPFVEPGRTACLRCVDAHLAEDDPHHPVLVSSAARVVSPTERREPIEAALATMALGWAVRDLVRYAEGDPVSTWSATVRWGPDDIAVSPRAWTPHPACGCGWARSPERPGRHYRSSTMGA